jgi:hypothetical protein
MIAPRPATAAAVTPIPLLPLAIPHPLLLHIAPSTSLLLVVLLLLLTVLLLLLTVLLCRRLAGWQCQLLLLLLPAGPYALCAVGLLLHPVWHRLLRTLGPLLVKLVCR